MGNKFSLINYKESYNTFLSRPLSSGDYEMIDSFFEDSVDLKEVNSAILMDEASMLKTSKPENLKLIIHLATVLLWKES
jgi:hypothetical protein